ncbi:MAG: hypothetical protein WC343_10250, partial [Bacilli bacterium]
GGHRHEHRGQYLPVLDMPVPGHIPDPGGGPMSAGTGVRRRARRHNAEAQWRAYHKRQKAIYRTLLEEPGACDYAINLRGLA